MTRQTVGGGTKKILYALKTARRVGLRNTAKALNSRNTCKACGLGMGGQNQRLSECARLNPEQVAGFQGQAVVNDGARHALKPGVNHVSYLSRCAGAG